MQSPFVYLLMRGNGVEVRIVIVVNNAYRTRHSTQLPSNSADYIIS